MYPEGSTTPDGDGVPRGVRDGADTFSRTLRAVVNRLSGGYAPR
ncbi:hypothetical protein HMPREF1162_1607 [ [[Propionibacterium] namnetense SK182B-JCVI]|uniref:Uncharacterized protein n=1 Tax=[Propionibacterium] namnetense SK182B-JCVI TaxID=1051006 RepID=F9NYA3_9ACTN|nr:hypothetical protein HMPREF1162_1607 [ [[Propionibacterium] namnetense SK182B-JCVI]